MNQEENHELAFSRSHLAPCRPLDESDWDRWAVSGGDYSDEEWRVKVQHFDTGGYEATVVRVSRNRICNRIMSRPSGRRTGVGYSCEAGRDYAAARARKRVRHLCRQIGADHLLTLTTRESESSLDQCLTRWQSFVRLYRAAIGNDAWEYVATVEAHPKNPKHLHLHVACAGRIDVTQARRCWHEALRGVDGNVDAQYIRASSDELRVIRIAKYLAKYVGKAFDVAGFNKRKYWPSRIDIPELRRYVLSTAKCASSALAELSAVLGLKTSQVQTAGHFFWFPHGDGFWLEFIPCMAEPPPF